MSRYATITVNLDGDLDEEHVEDLCKCIRRFRGVLSAKPAELANAWAQERARQDLGKKVIDAIWPERSRS